MRVISTTAALLVVFVHASVRSSSNHHAVSKGGLPLDPPGKSSQGLPSDLSANVEQGRRAAPFQRWHLLQLSSDQDEEDSDDVDNANCTHPLSRNDSCSFVQDNCADDVQLFNYLGFVACTLPHVKVSIGAWFVLSVVELDNYMYRKYVFMYST